MKKLLYTFGALFALLLLAGAGYAYYLYDSVQETVDSEMHVELERDRDKEDESEEEMDNLEPLSFLLLGVDAEDSTSGLADTIMVVTVNPEDDSLKMVSLPRDLRVNIPGQETPDKINHSYGYGGPDLIMDTVENYLDIPLDYFVTVNMEGFEEIIDALGGVTVENSFAFEQNEFYFEEGEHELSGEEALAYARMRKEDPDGDIGRNSRQREIVNSMINEGAQLSSIGNAQGLLNALGNNVLTNLDFEKMRKLQQNYASARHDQETLQFDYENERIDGLWFVLMEDEERQRLSEELRYHLDISDTKVAELSDDGED
jgi:polyisoprenyl-teichoic acid--peptidoglycan teichoic acid transferase